MFRMLGRNVELIRYKVAYTKNGHEMIESCISDEHKIEVKQMLTDKNITFTTTPINQTGNEWFNGLEFNSYDEALAVLNNGKTVYDQSVADTKTTSNIQLRADTDYLSIMTGVEL